MAIGDSHAQHRSLIRERARKRALPSTADWFPSEHEGHGGRMAAGQNFRLGFKLWS
jgi:hypothetical protein